MQHEYIVNISSCTDVFRPVSACIATLRHSTSHGTNTPASCAGASSTIARGRLDSSFNVKQHEAEFKKSVDSCAGVGPSAGAVGCFRGTCHCSKVSTF